MNNTQETIKLKFTKHAEVRVQQRSIKIEWINMILEFGRYKNQATKNSTSIALDKKGVQKIKQVYGNLKELNKIRKIYLILSGNSELITCAYRY